MSWRSTRRECPCSHCAGRRRQCRQRNRSLPIRRWNRECKGRSSRVLRWRWWPKRRGVQGWTSCCWERVEDGKTTEKAKKLERVVGKSRECLLPLTQLPARSFPCHGITLLGPHTRPPPAFPKWPGGRRYSRRSPRRSFRFCATADAVS